jgi:phage-related protein
MQKTLNGTANKLKGVGKKMSAAITAPIVGLGTVAFAAADEIDQAYRDIRVGTGATGEKLDDLKQSFEDVFTSVPDSADAVSNALATINTLTGTTGDLLEDLTTNVLDASRTLGEDGVANSEAFGRAMKQWQIPAEEGVGQLDHLYKMTQDYGVGLGEISTKLTTYGSVLGNAGFEMSEAAEFMASLESNGISVSRVMPGLNKSFRDWASEGKNSREELEKMVTQIRETEDSQEALSLATDVFGAEGAQRLMTAIRNGAIPAFSELGDSATESAGLIKETTEDTKTIGEEFQELKNNAIVALQPLGEILIDLAKDYLPPLIEGVTKVSEWFRNLSPQTQNLIIIIGALLAILGPLVIMAGMIAASIAAISWPVLAVVAGIAALIAIGVLLWKNWDTIKAKSIEIWTSLKEWMLGLFANLKDSFNSFLDFIDMITGGKFKIITDTIRAQMELAEQIIKDIFGFIEKTFENGLAFLKALVTGDTKKMKEVFSDQMQNISDFASKILDRIKGFFSDAWDRVLDGASNFKDGFLNVWRGIKDGIRGFINLIIGFIDSLIRGIESMVNAVARGVNSLPSFDIPDWVPGIGGGSFGLPSVGTISLSRIPSLDVGTNFVAADGLAYLHEGEAVVPKEYNPAAGGSGGVYEFHLEIPLDGETLVKRTITFTARELEKMRKKSKRGRGGK